MPIAILPELTAALSRTGTALAPWSRLVLLEEQILRRARSAFLVHWFGTGLPLRGLNLHVALTNVAALKDRFLLARRSLSGPGPELNLLGPFAAIGGVLVGLAMSPTGAVLIASQMHRIQGLIAEEPWGGIIGMLYNVLGAWIVPVLLPTVGLPLALLTALGASQGGAPMLRATYLVLGELAMLFDAAVAFWEQLSGPRSEVRNPLLGSVLGVLDRIAGLFAQVLGFAALFVLRIAPLLPRLLDQFRAMGGLLGAVFEALQDTFRGFVDKLTAPFQRTPNLLSVLGDVLESMKVLPGEMMRSLGDLLTDITSDLIDAVGAVSSEIDAFVDQIASSIRAAFEQTALGLMLAQIERLMGLMPALEEAFRGTDEADAAPQSSGTADADDGGDGEVGFGAAAWIATGGFTGALADLLNSFGGIRVPGLPEVSLPEFPETPAIPSLESVMNRIGEPPGLDTASMTERMEAEADAVLSGYSVPASLLRDPRSGFDAERAALPPRPRLRLDDVRLRDLIYLAVGRVLPPALRVEAPVVRELFDTLDEEVYDVERAPLEHPLLDIETEGPLRPVVTELTIRAEGGQAPDLRAFRDLLLGELRERTYAIPATG